MAGPEPGSGTDPATDPRDRFFDVTGMAGKVGRRAGRGGSVTLVFAPLKVALLLGTTAVLARLIPPEEFGVVALAMPFLAISTNLSQFGLAQAVSQRPHVTHALASSLFWLNLALGLVIGLVLAALGPLVAGIYGDPRIAPVFATLGLAILFGSASSQYLAIYWRQMRIPEQEVINLTAITLSTAAAVGAALAGASYWAIVVQQVVLPLAALSLLAARIGWRPSRPRRMAWSEIGSSVKFGGHLAAFTLLFQIAESLGTLIAGRALGQTAAGLYFRAWNLSRMPGSMLLLPLGATFIPGLSRLQEEAVAFRAFWRRAVLRILLIITPIGMGLVIAAPEIVRVMFGPAWAAAAPVLAVLGLRVLIGPVSSGLRWALVASGHSWTLSFCAALHLVMAAAALLLARDWGLVGLAGAYVAVEAVTVLGLFGGFALRHTALDLRDLGRILAELGLLAALTGLAGAAALMLTAEAGVLLRLAAMLAAMLAVTGLRILVQGDLRRDAAAVVAPVLSRLRQHQPGK